MIRFLNSSKCAWNGMERWSCARGKGSNGKGSYVSHAYQPGTVESAFQSRLSENRPTVRY